MCLSPISKRTPNGMQYVPCGKCRECMQTRRRDWSIRSLFEFEDSIKNNWKPYFITFTYDDECIPTEVCEETGEVIKVLRYDDWHKCTNYLRVAYSISSEQYRYLLCGEYGSKRLRPHYHVLLFTKCDNFIKYLGDYWYQHFCTKAFDMVTNSIPDSSGRVYRWGELGFVVTPVTVTDPASPIKVARYISKYVVKGSFDFTKNNVDYKEFYKKYPARVYASRAYGLSRLDFYKEQLKQFTGKKRIKSKIFRNSYGTVKETSHEHWYWTSQYLDFIHRTLRVYLGQDCRDPTQPYYAALPKAYFDRLLPKKMYTETVLGFDSTGGQCLERNRKRVKEIGSFVSSISLQTAISYYLQEDMLRKSLRDAERSTRSKNPVELDKYLREQDDINRLRNDRLSAEFEYNNAAHYASEKDFQ